MSNRIFVVIPNWNGADLIGPCLDSLADQTAEHTVIVVDNGSTDGSADFVSKQYPHMSLRRLSHNTGFTGGVNAGIKPAIDAGAEYVILFNNDAVADKDWVKSLVACADANPQAGIITSKFMRLDKTHLDSTGEGYSTRGLPFPRGRNERDTGQYDAATTIFAATGGASLYRVAMLKQIGLFDDDYFAYYEDVDISFRAQLAGWEVMYEPKAVAFHHVSATSSRLGDFARYHSAKNFLLVYARNMPLPLYLKYLPLFTLQFLRMAAGALVRRKFLVFLRGTFAAIKLHPSTSRKRRAIQKSRAVPVHYIDSMLFHGKPPVPPKIEELS
jgi:GT2 family glycosyltransferase